jgi:hypothetical protein
VTIQEYTTAQITSRPLNGSVSPSPAYALGTWLNPPVEAYSLDTNGNTVFSYVATSNQVEFVVATARHVDTYPAVCFPLPPPSMYVSSASLTQ